jgi:hypothetical protein
LLAKLSPARPPHAAWQVPVKAKAKATPPVVEEEPAVARLEQVVAAAVPVVEEPVTRVTQAVVAVVHEVPVVGGGGGVTLPLPGADGTGPLPQLEGVVPIAEPGSEPGTESDTETAGQTLVASTKSVSDSAGLLAASLRPHGEPSGQGAVPRSHAVPTQEPSPAVPWPTPQPAPMPTTPSAGAGQAAADLATTPATVSLLTPHASGRDHADWHVPGSLPPHPGTRPD